MRARIDITEVEVGTKIRAKYLRALENEEWDLLPGPVYVRSFLKTYGDYLGLDSRLLVDEFKRRYERPSDHELGSRASTMRERERSRRTQSPGRVSGVLFSPRTVIVVALVVILGALYLIGTHNQRNSTANSGGITPATHTSATAGRQHHPGSRSGTNGAGNHPVTNTVPKIPKPHRTPRATLTLAPTASVWICVENQTGKPLMAAAIYTAGQTIPTLRAKELLLTLGNPSVTMTVNGKPYTPHGSSAIGLKITAKGAVPVTPAPTCAG